MGLFGIGDGKIELTLDTVKVSAGDKIEGTATLILNTDVKANGVFAILYAEKTEIRSGNLSGETPQANKVSINVFQKEEKLDEAKLYLKSKSPYKYRFSFIVPKTSHGILTHWYIKVKLDIPLARDISKTEETAEIFVNPDVIM